MSKFTTQPNNNKRRPFLVMLTVAFLLTQSSCKKWLTIPPPGASITEISVYSTDATAIAVLNGLYSSMSSSELFQSPRSITLFAGLSADELTLYSGVTDNTHISYYTNQLAANALINAGSEHWSLLYPFVYRCNAAMEGIAASPFLTPHVKQQLLGEAYFLRSFFYFYLVNLFGDVPLALNTDHQANTLLHRTPKKDVYQQIIADLEKAKTLLSDDYLNETLLASTTERVRPTRWVATALLARVYLYAEDYAKAEEQATLVINNSDLYGLVALNEVFLKNSREAIWQIQPTSVGFNTEEGRLFIIPETGPTDVTVFNPNPVYLSEFILNSFEAGDQRGVYGNWVNTTIYPVSDTEVDTVAFAFKYKVSTSPDVSSPKGMTEYLMVLRLGEQYLIRAEARVRQNKIPGAQEDINAIRTRAGLGPTLANDNTSLLAAILHERRVELFTEFGHRWLDLKRTGQVDAVMSIITPLKANGTAWQSYQQWYPLPFSELGKSPNLVQNTGY